MSKLIIVCQGKHDTYYYDASTAKAKEKSLKKIFKENKDMTFYDELQPKGFKEHKEYVEKQIAKHKDQIELNKKHDEDCSREEEYVKRLQSELKETEFQKQLYDQAVKGSTEAMERLFRRRSSYQYESFEYKTLG